MFASIMFEQHSITHKVENLKMKLVFILFHFISSYFVQFFLILCYKHEFNYVQEALFFCHLSHVLMYVTYLHQIHISSTTHTLHCVWHKDLSGIYG